jgi:DNA-directed RNA polymerase specialized sigma24 family protein
VCLLADELADSLRVPLFLQRVEGLALEEVAALVGCSLATVKRRVAEGEARVRERFLRGEGWR